MEKKARAKDKIVTWDSHLDKKYGERGTTSRKDFEVKAHAFIVGEAMSLS